MVKTITVVLVICGAAVLAGCGPVHTVVDTASLKVYGAKVKDADNHKYEYAVTDNSGYGWRLLSNKKLNIGDEVEIVVKGAK